ncbi:universal stress protein [Microlunatus antarcticus]|uniref:Nucleotide-binding universal stress UspA family protein n=1 Tax=Microlunatus antarcticus TaxID=53388 RepID=A0A7W5P763_9ACTN|nr:universal stress protein [Microlunatus antarcticus]MBB3327230.1 nucleotide-binding universal stress UspA family protein [Microlunatus antarcticus]
MEPTYERTVVVGVDGSPDSLVAARYALRTAALRGLDVELVYSYPMPLVDVPLSGSFVDDFEQAGRDLLTGAVDALDVPPAVALRTRFAETLPALLMQELSRSAPLVVVGQHATAWFDRLGRGSVASPVAHHSGCPVVVVPPAWRQVEHERRPVVVALDGEAVSLATLDFALDEATFLGTEVVALHSVPGGTHGQTESAARNVVELLARAQVRHPSTPARVVTVRGVTQRVLLTAAESAAVLVLGPPHTDGLAAWTRSVARRVMGGVGCPLVVVPRRRHHHVPPASALPELLRVS